MTDDLFLQFFGRVRKPTDYAIALTRVSTDERTQKSGKDQVKLCERAATKLGLPVKYVYEDNMSRSLWPRPGVEGVLDRIMDPDCVAVLSWYADRLYGDQRQQYEVFDALQEHNVLLFDSELRLKNDDDEIAEVMAGIEALLANYEVRKLRKRVYSMARERFSEHSTWIQRPVFGMRFDEKADKIVLDKARLRVLRKMFRWVADEGLGTYAIAVKLQAMGVRTTPTRVDPEGQEFWNVATVRRLLHNEIYIGKMVWNRTQTVRRRGKKMVLQRPETEWITRLSPFGNLLAEPHDQDASSHDPETCQKCLDAVDLFRRTADVLTRRNKARGYATGRLNRTCPPRLLDNLVRCARCGRKMYPKRSGHRKADGSQSDRYEYRCATRRGSAGSCERSHVIPERTIMRHLFAWIEGNSLDEALTVTLVAGGEKADERQTIKRMITEIEDELDEYTRQLARKRLTEERFDRLRAEAESRMATALAQLDTLSPVATERKRKAMTESTRTMLAEALPVLLSNKAPIERRQALLQKHVERINVDLPAVEILAVALH